MALGWTALLLVTLLQSSRQPVVGPPAPPGQPTLARELLLTGGHIIGFSLLTLLWWRALITVGSARRALILAVVIALVIGTLTEVAQATIPDRSASLFDLTVNWLVTLATAAILHRTEAS